MAVYAQFDKDGACVQLASNTGWSEFGDWVETLKDCPRLSAMWDSGVCEDIPGLRDELEQQIQDGPPEDEDVLSVAHQVIHAIDAGMPAEILLTTAGVSQDPEETELADGEEAK